MSEQNLFEIAARKKYRFETPVGSVTVEDLYDLPLLPPGNTRAVRANLNDVARTINNQIKALDEESFVDQAIPGVTDLVNKLNLVKEVIAYKQAKADAAVANARKAQQRDTLRLAIAEAEAREIGSKSVDELKAMLKELDEG